MPSMLIGILVAAFQHDLQVITVDSSIPLHLPRLREWIIHVPITTFRHIIPIPIMLFQLQPLPHPEWQTWVTDKVPPKHHSDIETSISTPHRPPRTIGPKAPASNTILSRTSIRMSTFSVGSRSALPLKSRLDDVKVGEVEVPQAGDQMSKSEVDLGGWQP